MRYQGSFFFSSTDPRPCSLPPLSSSLCTPPPVPLFFSQNLAGGKALRVTMCSYSPGDEEGERSLFLWRDRAHLPACSLPSPSRTRKGIFWAHRRLQYAIQLCWSEWSLETQKKKKKKSQSFEISGSYSSKTPGRGFR